MLPCVCHLDLLLLLQRSPHRQSESWETKDWRLVAFIHTQSWFRTVSSQVKALRVLRPRQVDDLWSHRQWLARSIHPGQHDLDKYSKLCKWVFGNWYISWSFRVCLYNSGFMVEWDPHYRTCCILTSSMPAQILHGACFFLFETLFRVKKDFWGGFSYKVIDTSADG